MDIRSGTDDMLVQLIEVGPGNQNHRLVGRASDRSGACRLLTQWLDAIVVASRADRPGR